jgi:hypothetical protein
VLSKTRSILQNKRSIGFYTNIAAAAMYEYAVLMGFQFSAQALELYLDLVSCLYIINPFEDICFVIERPQITLDTQGNLHAEGEPCIVFPDGFANKCYFYHGIELPEYMGSVHPRQWKSEWVTQEQNAELRRVLIQEIGYARLCRELRVEELDSWREYTLLRIPIYDDFAASVQAKVTSLEADEMYLLKMTCSSTNFVHIIRVPPSMRLARDAATWINWGIDPESITHET